MKLIDNLERAPLNDDERPAVAVFARSETIHKRRLKGTCFWVPIFGVIMTLYACLLTQTVRVHLNGGALKDGSLNVGEISIGVDKKLFEAVNKYIPQDIIFDPKFYATVLGLCIILAVASAVTISSNEKNSSNLSYLSREGEKDVFAEYPSFVNMFFVKEKITAIVNAIAATSSMIFGVSLVLSLLLSFNATDEGNLEYSGSETYELYGAKLLLIYGFVFCMGILAGICGDIGHLERLGNGNRIEKAATFARDNVPGVQRKMTQFVKKYQSGDANKLDGKKIEGVERRRKLAGWKAVASAAFAFVLAFIMLGISLTRGNAEVSFVPFMYVIYLLVLYIALSLIVVSGRLVWMTRADGFYSRKCIPLPEKCPIRVSYRVPYPRVVQGGDNYLLWCVFSFLICLLVASFPLMVNIHFEGAWELILYVAVIIASLWSPIFGVAVRLKRGRSPEVFPLACGDFLRISRANNDVNDFNVSRVVWFSGLNDSPDSGGNSSKTDESDAGSEEEHGEKCSCKFCGKEIVLNAKSPSGSGVS